jgi:hypothetical protein
MKCPLFIMNDTRAQLGEETEIGDCLKEDCAWWDPAIKRCAILEIAGAGRLILNSLIKISERLPGGLFK